MLFIRKLIIVSLFLFVAVSPVFAEDYVDSAKQDSVNVLSPSASNLAGPYYVDYIIRGSSSSITIYFTNGLTYTTYIAIRQHALSFALAGNLPAYLYVDGTTVTGVLILTY